MTAGKVDYDKTVKVPEVEKSARNVPGLRKCTSQESIIFKPPDGGYGWIIVLASFVIHVLSDGFMYSYGSIFEKLSEIYEASPADTSWAGSILPAIILMSGPLASLLINQFGCRLVCIAGSLIASLSCIASVFCDSLVTLSIASFFLGMGLGFCYLPAIIMISEYFDAKKGIALGIAVCGSGIGTFIFPLLISWLLKEYGISGTFLVLAGLVLNLIPMGLLMRSLSDDEIIANAEELLIEDEKLLDKLAEDIEVQENGRTQRSLSSTGEPQANPRFYFGSQPIRSRRSRTDVAGSQRSFYDVAESRGTLHVRKKQPVSLGISQENEGSLLSASTDFERVGALQMTSKFSASISNMSQAVARFQASDLPGPGPSHIDESMAIDPHLPWTLRAKTALMSWFEADLLKHTAFLLYCISNFFTSFSYMAPYLFTPSYASSEVGSNLYLVPAIGFGNIAGRLFFGFLSDRPWMDSVQLYNFCLIFSGVAVFCYPFMLVYEWFMACSIGFGFLIGAYISLTAVVLIELVGVDRLNNSFSILLVFQGLATLIGSPLLGMLHASGQSYAMPYFFCGGILSFSGVMLIPIRLMHRCIHKRGFHADEKKLLTRSRLESKLVNVPDENSGTPQELVPSSSSPVRLKVSVEELEEEEKA